MSKPSYKNGSWKMVISFHIKHFDSEKDSALKCLSKTVMSIMNEKYSFIIVVLYMVVRCFYKIPRNAILYHDTALDWAPGLIGHLVILALYNISRLSITSVHDIRHHNFIFFYLDEYSIILQKCTGFNPFLRHRYRKCVMTTFAVVTRPSTCPRYHWGNRKRIL